MRRTLKAVGVSIFLVVVLLVGFIGLTIGLQPFLGPRARPLTSRTFERTPQRLERGRYLVDGLLGCMDCHSVRDWSKHDVPVVNNMMGAGDIFPAKGLPGRMVASNLTPDLETGVGTHGPSVGSRDHALISQVREVPADGSSGHSEQFREVIDTDGAVVVDDLDDRPQSALAYSGAEVPNATFHLQWVLTTQCGRVLGRLFSTASWLQGSGRIRAVSNGRHVHLRDSHCSIQKVARHYLTLPAMMPSTIHLFNRKTRTAGTAIAIIAAALIIV